jgi:hypothetical protein
MLQQSKTDVKMDLALATLLSGANALEISDSQEDDPKAVDCGTTITEKRIGLQFLLTQSGQRVIGWQDVKLVLLFRVRCCNTLTWDERPR